MFSLITFLAFALQPQKIEFREISMSPDNSAARRYNFNDLRFHHTDQKLAPILGESYIDKGMFQYFPEEKRLLVNLRYPTAEAEKKLNEVKTLYEKVINSSLPIDTAVFFYTSTGKDLNEGRSRTDYNAGHQDPYLKLTEEDIRIMFNIGVGSTS